MKKTTYRRRSVVAIGLALATLMAMANPAGAAVHGGAITGGILTSTKTGATETFNLAPTTPSCTPTSLTADFGTEVQSGNFMVTALGSAHDVAFSSGTFYVVLTRSNTGNTNSHWTSGSSTTSPHVASSGRVAILIQIYNTNGPCNPSNLVCSAAVLMHITNSTFPNSIAISNTFTVTSTSVGNIVAAPVCAAGPSQILGMTVSTTTAITGHITT